MAVNDQLLSGKSKFYVKLPEKNRNLSKICLETINFLVKLPEKIEFFLTRIHDPQISNQIDAPGVGILEELQVHLV